MSSSRAEQIARRLDALWPISDHTWEADGSTILNEWGTPIAHVSDDDSSGAIVDLITHSVGDLRWALGEIARLEAVAATLASHVDVASLPLSVASHVQRLQQSSVSREDICPLCHALDASSVVEEVRQ